MERRRSASATPTARDTAITRDLRDTCLQVHNRKINYCSLNIVCAYGDDMCLVKGKGRGFWAWLTYCSLRPLRQPHSNTPRTSTWQSWQLATPDQQTRQSLETETERKRERERGACSLQPIQVRATVRRGSIRSDRLAASVNLIKLIEISNINSMTRPAHRQTQETSLPNTSYVVHYNVIDV